MPLTLKEIKEHPVFKTFVGSADAHLGEMGYTEHGHRHVERIASIAQNLLIHLGFSQREAELAAIAGYLHDIGNVVSRKDHGQSSAFLAFTILREMGMEPTELGAVIGAIGNHEEEFGEAVNVVGAALILADKSDVHRSRVRNEDIATFDIHDRVNYAVVHSFLKANPDDSTITLELRIETEICPVMDYFEIFLARMIMCRRAAEVLGCSFKLEINGAKLL